MTPLIRFGISWMVGIALAGWLNPPSVVMALVALPAVGALLLYWQNQQARLWAVVVLAFVAGALYLLFARHIPNKTDIDFYNDSPKTVKLIGVIEDEPDVREYHINLYIRAEYLQIGDTKQPVKGRVLIRATRYPEYLFGDRLTIIGKLETPPIFKEFSYKDYLAREGVYSMIRRPIRIEHLASGQGNYFWAAMLSLKSRESKIINRILAEPYASLLNGILLGIRSGIPRKLYDLFNLTGSSHIIVISGSNIIIVAGILLFLTQKSIGKRYAPYTAITGIILYTFFVGADPSVSRAAVMGVTMLIAIWIGRPNMPLNALILSGIILTLINPLRLWDVGFQLSFMATLGLIVLYPPLERGTFRLLKRWLKTEHINLTMTLLSELLIITLAAQIMTTPIIVYHFGRLSIVSLLTNMLIVPVQPLIMTFGTATVLFGLLWLPLGQIVGWLVWLPLAWSVWVVEQTAGLPYASLDLGGFPFWLVILSYAAIAAGIWWANSPESKDKEAESSYFSRIKTGSWKTNLLLGGAAAVVLLALTVVLSLPDGRLHVTFLDVGQGDAILITLPDGRQLLVDGGPSATMLNWRLGQNMPFWDHSLDMVISTHPDMDHLGGLVSVLDRYQIGQILVTDIEGQTELYREWKNRLAIKQFQPTVVQAGMRLSLSRDITATILNPGLASQGNEKTNNHSIVLHLQYGKISFLLPGDIESPIEGGLTAPLKATVLKSPHHGSKTSSSEQFLQAVNPSVVVISIGEKNRYGHPAPEIMKRYAEHSFCVIRTDRQGTVDFSSDGKRLWVDKSCEQY